MILGYGSKAQEGSYHYSNSRFRDKYPLNETPAMKFIAKGILLVIWAT